MFAGPAEWVNPNADVLYQQTIEYVCMYGGMYVCIIYVCKLVGRYVNQVDR